MEQTQLPLLSFSGALDTLRGVLPAPYTQALPTVSALILLHTVAPYQQVYQEQGLRIEQDLVQSVQYGHLDARALRELLPRLARSATQLELLRDLDGKAVPDEVLFRLSSIIASQVARVSLLEPDQTGLLRIGRAFTEFLEYASKANGIAGAVSMTPLSLAQLLVDSLDVQPGMRVLDIATGYARTTVTIAQRLRDQGLDPNSVLYVGQEIDRGTAQIAAVHLLLHGVTNFRLHVQNTLTASDTPLSSFDRVFGDPPFGLQVPHLNIQPERDPRFALAPQRLPRTADWLFIQHGLASLKPGGRAAFITPHAPLFRGGVEESIRAAFTQGGWLDAVIALPSALYAGVGIQVALTLFDRPEASIARHQDVLMFDGSALGSRDGRLQVLDTRARERVVQALRARADEPEFARLVTTLEVLNHESIWEPNHYIPRIVAAGRDLDELRDELMAAEAASARARARLQEAFDVLRRA